MDTYTSYGSASNLWGPRGTVADVKSNHIRGCLQRIGGQRYGTVDHMRITITGTNLTGWVVEFFSKCNDEVNDLHWQTASEHQKFQEFIIQRSDGLSDFVDIGVVNGQGNKLVISEYEFTGSRPVGGNNYYRLKQVDLDGSFRTPRIEVVNKNLMPGEPQVFPSPFATKIKMCNMPETWRRCSNLFERFKAVRQFRLQSGMAELALTELYRRGLYDLLFGRPVEDQPHRKKKTADKTGSSYPHVPLQGFFHNQDVSGIFSVRIFFVVRKRASMAPAGHAIVE